MSARAEAWLGAREVAPLALGVAAYGLAFGLLAAQAGMSGLQVGVMGASVFAGASQIVAVERLAAGAGAGAALVAGLALNLRLVLVTASIRALFEGRPLWQRVLGAHMSTDENWALTVAARKAGRPVGWGYLVGSGLAILAAWLASTLTGALVATSLPEPRALGMDFAFTAAFVALARSLWRGRADALPWMASAGVTAALALSGVFDPSWALVAGGVAGAALAARG